MLSFKEENFVVIDNGSWRIKARKGVPKEIFDVPSLFLTTEVEHKYGLGTEKETSNALDISPGGLNSTENSKYYKETIPPTKGSLSLIPIERGEIKRWADLEGIWRNILLKEFNIKRSRNECPVLLTTPNRWTKTEYERIAQIFFEHFNTPALYIADQALMALFGCGSVNGIVVDVGYGTTDITPILDTSVQYHAIQTLPIGGQDIDKYLLSLLQSDIKLLQEYGNSINLDFARAMKETVCGFMSFDGEETGEERKEVEYMGTQFTIGSERFQAAEPFFAPCLVGKGGLATLPDAIYFAISSCEIDKRGILWENIVFTGGSSLLKGFKERLQKELEVYLNLSDNAGDHQTVKEPRFLKIPDYFTNFKDRPDLAPFLGASIVAKLVFGETNSKSYISKVDYNEKGPSVVHTKSY
ncbi:hypothetical protein G9A89_017636 [Geosiphon pyriformis]|nr:hypothetical protein G9A89_017636 [Geosiphon pyriformis]